jgi:hypothetical protein
MSKNLLESARKVRSRLQPALVKEAKAQDDMAYRKNYNPKYPSHIINSIATGRLLFLDNTLQGMIQRFEDEYPECRPQPQDYISTVGIADDAASSISSHTNSLTDHTSSVAQDSLSNSINLHGSDSASDDEYTDARMERSARSSRHNSDVSQAARALSIEEGHMHRMGQKVKRELLSPAGLEDEQGIVIEEAHEPDHLKLLRAKLSTITADELRDSVITDGWESTAQNAIDKAAMLRKMEKEEPEKLREIREKLIEEGRM